MKQLHLIALVSITLGCALVYSNTLETPFIYDDFHNIKDNPHIRLTELDPSGLRDAAFQSPISTRPLVYVSFALNYYFGGYEVRGYHAVNIGIHILNGILVYFLALLILRRLPEADRLESTAGGLPSAPLAAILAALVFGLHPLQTQSVTYIVQRMNSMAVLFYLLAFLLYILARRATPGPRKWLMFGASLVSWGLALGSKENAATLPLVVILYEWLLVGELRADWLRRNLKYAVVLVLLLLIVVFLFVGGNPLERISNGYARRDFSMAERLWTECRVVVFHISQVLLPIPARQNLIHHFPVSSSMLVPATTFLSLASIVGLIGLAIGFARRQRVVPFCILWFFLHLMIESSVLALEIIYEHRLYLPMFGVALMTGYLVYRYLPNRRVALAITVIAAVMLGAAAYKRNAVWRDDLSLWSDVVSKNATSLRAQTNLGLALKHRKRTEEAIRHFEAALEIDPTYMRARCDLGNTLKESGRLNEAIAHYNEALKTDPESPLVTSDDFARTHSNLGATLAQQGDLPAAVVHFGEALRINPRSANAHNNLGAAMAQQGDLDAAILHFRAALELMPGYVDAERNLQKALAIQRNMAGDSSG